MTVEGWRKELIIVVVLGLSILQIADISETYITPARAPF